MLLKADEAPGGPGWSDERLAEAVGVGVATVERLRQRCVAQGLAAALRPYRVGQRLYSGSSMASRVEHAPHPLSALACSAPPEGRGPGTLRRLARRLVELRYPDALSPG